MRAYWSTTEEQLLREMLDRNVPFNDIINHPVFRNRSTNSLRSKAARMGYSLFQLSLERREREVQMILKSKPEEL